MQVLPLFRTHYSIGKSILTLDTDVVSGCADSALVLAKEYGLKEVFIVDESLSGVLEAKKNCDDLGLKLIFGLRVGCTSQTSITKKDEFYKNLAKYIIFCKNSNGYKRLIRLFSWAATTGAKHGTPSLTFEMLKKEWSDDDLMLAIPFYDGYVDLNKYHLGNHIEDLFFTKKLIFLIEDNGLFFDAPLQRETKKEIERQSKTFEVDTWRAKTIYYNMKEDFEAFQVRKCIAAVGRKPTLSAPNVNHLHSNMFSFESWIEENENKI